jgi:flavin-dependent dehydrogenase
MSERSGPTVAERFDVIVVGARCAGSPLATLLARQGLRVAVLERASFPRDTLSTHIFQAPALAFLDRLGVIDQVRLTGAPFLALVNVRQEHLEFTVEWPQAPGDVGGIASVRRFVLDPILADAATEAGAEVRMDTKVTGLVTDRGRVSGVRVASNGVESAIEARLVVGADGRNSTVASLAGSRKYNPTPNERFGYWAFFEGAELGAEPQFVFHRWSDRLVFATPCDSGLYQVIVLADLQELPRFREDLEGSYMEYACSCRPVAEALSGARRVGKFFGMLRFEGFFREASGPGWVLVGDAGHFKDPAPGQGIQDAFRQVEALAPRIVEGLRGSDQDLDRELSAWARWRDHDAAEHYWFATDLGKAGPVPAVMPEIARRLLAQGKMDLFIDLFNHRTKPSKVITPPRLLGATGRLLVRRGCGRRALLCEVGGLAAEDARRKRLNRRPAYVAAGVSADAGPTEIPETVAA